ncbi:hypothetical protein AVEN_230426-1 [Araneus ventricosus]|uniref:Uncharacterized protein n=1 Tax=Araneus ventricosus TaxID=182803 RepID=A0A4Y2U493_ARAVE|nr:hypothetical protein AVEN_230426-1 [Araneus ventricosus]
MASLLSSDSEEVDDPEFRYVVSNSTPLTKLKSSVFQIDERICFAHFVIRNLKNIKGKAFSPNAMHDFDIHKCNNKFDSSIIDVIKIILKILDQLIANKLNSRTENSFKLEDFKSLVDNAVHDFKTSLYDATHKTLLEFCVRVGLYALHFEERKQTNEKVLLEYVVPVIAEAIDSQIDSEIKNDFPQRRKSLATFFKSMRDHCQYLRKVLSKPSESKDPSKILIHIRKKI